LNTYESDKLLNEYLLFHYGSESEICPPSRDTAGALFFPVRCVKDCVDLRLIPDGARALDLGCAVGRSTFELAHSCASVLGIDFSRRFIEAAEALRKEGTLRYSRADEGMLSSPVVAEAPRTVDRGRVAFETGDAMELRGDIGTFDVVLMANLIDRLREPRRCLARLPGLVKPGGQLIITSPYTWLEDFTPREHWLGGFERDGVRVTTLEGLREALAPAFDLHNTKDLPFLIREHSRKFQFSVAQASIWRRK
jgi:putative 4-mercaptohistidine N1-methyltranferase